MTWTNPVNDTAYFFPWEDGLTGGTPLNAANLDDMQQDLANLVTAMGQSLAAYTDQQVAAAVLGGGGGSVSVPSNTGVPVISGTPTVGLTLTCTTGTWSGSPTSFAYQWNRNGTAITGATGTGYNAASYTLQSADLGDAITVTVTASNSAGSASATSAATATVTVATASQIVRALNAHPMFCSYPGTLDQQFTPGLLTAGAQAVRWDLVWYQMQKSRPASGSTADVLASIQANDPGQTYSSGAIYLARYDYAMQWAAQNGVKVMLMVSYPPAWSQTSGTVEINAPPTSWQDYINFVVFLAKRYSTGGAGVVAQYGSALESMEFWNEPDLSYSWDNSLGTCLQRSAAYVAGLKLVYPALKAAVPSLLVCAPAVSFATYDTASAVGNVLYDWLTDFYTAQPVGYYDVLTIHCYGDPPSHNGLGANDSPAQVVADWSAYVWPTISANDPNARVWVTEVGWNTGPDGVTPAAQATDLTGVYAAFAALQQPVVERTYWYSLVDEGAVGGSNYDLDGNNYGLYDINWATKPALAAFQQLAGAPSGTQPVGPGGAWTLTWEDDFTGSALDTTKWSIITSTTINNVTPAAANVAVVNNQLVLTLASSTSGAAIVSGYNSHGAATPSNGVSLSVGDCVEFKASIPGYVYSTNNDKAYNWPALWTVGEQSPGWPVNGEIDIVEGTSDYSVNYHHGTAPGQDNPIGSGAIPGNWATGFHTFTAVRGTSSVQVYWDGTEVYSFNTADTGGAQSIIMNVGYLPGGQNVFGAASQVLVDYVRVWTPGGSGGGGTLTLSSAVASVSGTTATVTVYSTSDIVNISLLNHGTQVKAAADQTPSGGVATFTVAGLSNGSYSFDAVGYTVPSGQPGGSNTPTVTSNTITVTAGANPSISTLPDPFSTSTLNSAWTLDSGATLTISGDAGTIPVNTGYTGISTLGVYDLTGKRFAVKVAGPTGDGDGEALVCLFDSAGGALYWEINPATPSIKASSLTDATGNAQAAGTTVSSTDQWFSFRESGGTIYWEYAPDASGSPGAWVLAQSQTLATAGIAAITGLQVRLRSGTYGTAGSSTSVFSKVNGGSSAAVAPLIGVELGTQWTANQSVILSACGAQVVRIDYDQYGATAAASIISTLKASGRKINLLVGASETFTSASTVNPSTIASFVASNPVDFVEVGNEDLYSFKTSNANMQSVASALALNTKALFQALPSTVKVLCQVDTGGLSDTTAVNYMYAAVPGLHNYCAGWVCHAYGNTASGSTSNPLTNLSNLVAATSAAGAPSNFPIYVTEYGIATDNGNTVVATFDGVTNYGWPLNLTYQQAAADLTNTFNTVMADYPQIAMWSIFADVDEQPHGTNTGQDDHFGVCFTTTSGGTPTAKPYYAAAVAALVGTV
jgi:hypothetical protein